MQPVLGKTALLGITTYDRQGALIDQQQFIGTIEKADCEHGVIIRLRSGETKTVPPDMRAVLYAPPGIYKHQATGETVTDPDYLLSWNIRCPEDANSPAEWAPNYAPFYQPRSHRDWELQYRRDDTFVKELIEIASSEYIGGKLLMGITYYRSVDGRREFLRQEQLHGEIVRISYAEGVVVQLAGGNEIKLPPDLSLIEPGPPGEYRLRSTGEVVIDPDFITMWDKFDSE
jgi:hypothetical protein